MSSPSTDRRYGLNSSVAIKVPCQAASIAALTLYGEQTVDTVALMTGDRCLVKNQTNPVDNGIYTVDTGDWTRAVDANGNNDFIEGTLVFVTGGTQSVNLWAIATSGDIIIGTTPINWEQAADLLFNLGGSQWLLSGLTPTFISISSLTLVGNQTVDYHPGRRVQLLLNTGYVYANIVSSVFSTSTLITLQVDNGGVINNTLSQINPSILRADFLAIPSIFNQSFSMAGVSFIGAKGVTLVSAATVSVYGNTDGNMVDISGSTGPITSFGTSPQAGFIVDGTFTGAPILQQSANLTFNAGDNAVFNGTITGTNLLTVNSVTSGVITVGDQITGIGITSGGVVSSFGTGAGGTGTYNVTVTQNVGPIAMISAKRIQISVGDVYRAKANTTSQIDVVIMKKSGGFNANGDASLLSTGTLPIARLPVGTVVDRAYAELNTTIAYTAQIPTDNTIPQITEGTQVLSVTITPKSTTNRIRLSFAAFASANAVNNISAALFSSLNANALNAHSIIEPTSGYSGALSIQKETVPGVISAVTYSVRVGPNAASSMYLNSNGTTALFGGAAWATLIAEEIQA